MNKSNYDRFLKKFNSKLRKEYDLRKNEFTPLEILNNTFLDYRYTKQVKIVFFYVLLILGIAFFPMQWGLNGPFKWLIWSALLFVFPLFVLSFNYLTDRSYFNKLHSRIKAIESMLLPTSELTIDDLFELVESKNLNEKLGEKTAIQAYYEFKINHLPKNQNKEYRPLERLTLLFILLNEEFDYKTNDKEFNTLLGALLNISPNRLEKEYRSFLNRLNAYIKNKPGNLSKQDLKEIRGILKELKTKLDVDSLLSNLIDQNYESSVFPVREN